MPQLAIFCAGRQELYLFIGGKLMLAIDNYLALAVFAISLDNRDHLW
jgi:hypothetical protein